MVFCSCGNGGFDTTFDKVIEPFHVEGPFMVMFAGIVTRISDLELPLVSLVIVRGLQICTVFVPPVWSIFE